MIHTQICISQEEEDMIYNICISEKEDITYNIFTYISQEEEDMIYHIQTYIEIYIFQEEEEPLTRAQQEKSKAGALASEGRQGL